MKKFVSLLLAVLMVASLAACGQKTDSNPSPSPDEGTAKLKILDTEYVTEDYAIAVNKGNTALLEKINGALKSLIDDGTVQKVVDYYISGTGELPKFQENVAADAEVLTMATNAEFPPYEFYDGEAIVGIDAVVAALIADQLGMKLEISDMAFESIIPALTSSKADMAMAGMTVTDERKESVDFSESYATGVQVIIVRGDSDITSADDITAKIEQGEDIQIGCQIGTTGFIYASDTPEKGGFGEDHVQAFPKGADAVQALVTGKIDCVIIDNEPAKAFVAANNG